jgi:GNAT superfamily N-acetyltransferase
MTEAAIRPAQPEDAEAIVALIGQLAEYEQLSHLVQITADGIRQDLFGERPAAECVLVWEEGEAVGFALFFHNYSTFLGKRGLYLEDLFVVPAARGRGYGKALLQYLARLAVERGCGRFEWSVLDWNEPAIGFYRSMGATVMPDWRICRATGEALRAMADGDAAAG